MFSDYDSALCLAKKESYLKWFQSLKWFLNFQKQIEIHLFLPFYFVVFLFLIFKTLLITLKNIFQSFYSIFLFTLYAIIIMVIVDIY